jgi:ADP-heptose:LPS heptosyltransferase
MLSLHELMAIIDMCPTLVSNDSAPIHIAGAFDNNIILIPTCKHPDHLLPWRNGSKYYKAKAFYKKLMCDDIKSSPTEVYTVLGDGLTGEWDEYLPDVETVVVGHILLLQK